MYTHEPVSTIRIITPKSFLLPQLPKKELFQTFWNFSLCFLCFHNSDVFNTMILIVCQFFSQLLQWERQPAMIYYVIFGNRSLICFLFCVRPAFLNLGPTDILGQIIIFFLAAVLCILGYQLLPTRCRQHSCSCDTHKCLQTLQMFPAGQNCTLPPQMRNQCVRLIEINQI